MTVNIVVFIDCYSTIYLLLRTSSEKKIKGACVFLAPCISKFFGGKITPFWKEFRKIKKKNWRMRILSASYFSKFFGGKIKNFEQGFGEQKMTKNKLTRLQNKN